MSLTKLRQSLVSDIPLPLFSARESLVRDIPAGDGKIFNIFLQFTVKCLKKKNPFLGTGRQCRGRRMTEVWTLELFMRINMTVYTHDISFIKKLYNFIYLIIKWHLPTFSATAKTNFKDIFIFKKIIAKQYHYSISTLHIPNKHLCIIIIFIC
jgi:hypothetical protein